MYFFIPTWLHFKVLAHRGNSWILLQNACRVLWNAMSTLVNTLTQHLNSEPAQEGMQYIDRSLLWSNPRSLHVHGD